MAWLGIWFNLSNNCDGVWSNGIGQYRETGEECDEACVEEGFQLGRVKYDRDGERGREGLDVGNCSINIWDVSELELTWSNKNSSYFENNFSIFWYYPLFLILSGILNISICKVRDVLHRVNFLSRIKIFSSIFHSTFSWGR